MKPANKDAAERSSLLSSSKEATLDSGEKDNPDASSDARAGANKHPLELRSNADPDEQTCKNARNIIITPSDQDVLFGRGRPFQSHPGNIHLHRLVALHKDRYEHSRRFDKFAIADQIVYEVKNGGGNRHGRFLRRVQGEDYWEEAPDDVSREKVAHALRGHIKQARENRKQDQAVGLGTIGSNIKSGISRREIVNPQADSLSSSSASAQRAVALVPSESQAISSMSVTASMPFSLLNQQRSSLQPLRQGISIDVPSTFLTAMPAAQRQQQQQLQMSQASDLNTVLQRCARDFQSVLSLDSLANMLSAQQRQQQERLLAFHLLQQSNEMNPFRPVLDASISNQTSLGIPRSLSTNRTSVDNALVVLQQVQAARRNLLLSPLSSVGATFDMGARQFENTQVCEAIARALRGQQQQNPSRHDEAKDTSENPSTRRVP